MGIDVPDGANYDIEPELRVRKLLEKETSWKTVITRNDNKYARDLEYFRWEHDGREWGKSHLGYIEVEQGDKWYGNQYPDNWVYLTFLERKVQEWNSPKREFSGLKHDAGETVYLKFNQEFSNCFAASMVDIYHHGEITRRSDGTKSGTMRSLPFDHGSIYTGVSDCVEFIHEFMEGSNGTLGEFVGGER